MPRYFIHEDVIYGWSGSWTPPEKDLIEWAYSFCEPGKRFVDVGAHVGTWTLGFAEQGREVVAFEAQRKTFYRLCYGIADNGLEHRVIAHHTAIGARAGEIELRIIGRDGGQTSTVALSTHEVPSSVEIVPVRTLDSYGLGDVGLIKIDVEGAEIDVLRGARETLERNGYPKIFFESWVPHRMPEAPRLREELFLFLEKELGYRVVPLNGNAEMFLAERA